MSRGTRPVLWLLSGLFAGQMLVQSLARYATYHNRTYDLALYARQAWGLAHHDYWDPIVNAHFLGTHVSLVLWPLGYIGSRFGTVNALLIAQALAFGLATLPLARIGARRFGSAGALCAALAWLLYPNISQVASYEFHPGSLAVLPLAFALDALDARRGRALVLACIALLACRADFALLTLLLGASAMVFASRTPSLRVAGGGIVVISVAYLAVQFLWLRPHFWATHNSLDLHFARWGGSPFGIVRALFQQPGLVREHVLEPRRLAYLPMILLPLAGLSLLAPRWLLFTLPFIAINLISTFPTTTEMYSHYLTPAVPSLVVGALDGLAIIAAHARRRVWAPTAMVVMLLLSLMTNIRSGGLPWSLAYDAAAYRVDDVSKASARVVGAIARDASVQAPDSMLPHLIERAEVFRGPPPDRAADYVVLDVSQRDRYARQENLLRTIEEPVARNWLARRDYGLVQSEPGLLLLAREHDPRSGPAARYLPRESATRNGIALTRCLSVLSAWLDPQGLELELSAHAPCPADLALRIGSSRVDLLFDGLLSPAHLHDEKVFSWHALDASERAAISQQGLRLGALRSSGAPPEQGDPVSLPIPLVH